MNKGSFSLHDLFPVSYTLQPDAAVDDAFAPGIKLFAWYQLNAAIPYQVLISDSFPSLQTTSGIAHLQVYPLYLGSTPNLNKQVVDSFASALGLAFAPTEAAGSVCFANHPDLRSDFKQTFSPIDLLAYVYAVLLKQSASALAAIPTPNEGLLIPYPEDGESFWELVALGGKIGKNSKKHLSTV